MKNRTSKKKKIIIISIILIVIISITIFTLLKILKKQDNTKIIAIKTITTENGKTQTIVYTIIIKDYILESAIKEIEFSTEEEAKLEYNKYEIINKYERREIGLELKKKKLILIMPEKQLKIDIEYKEEENIKLLKEPGVIIEVINEDELKQCLINQGYELK